MKRKEFYKMLDREGFDRLRVRLEIDNSDLNSATIYAEQDIKDKWEHYKQRYFKGLKK